jgi:hypothetical protein
MAEGSLTTGIEMLRLAKQDEEDDNVILLSSPPNCESWTKVRVDTIAQLRVVVPNFRCQDHEHPLILLRLKEPETGVKDQLAGLVSELLKPQPPSGGPVFLLREEGGLPDPTGSGGAPTVGDSLTVSFGVDLIGTAPSTVRVTATGHVVNPEPPPGGSVMFNVSQTYYNVPPLPHQYLTVIARGLQRGAWCVWAGSSISGWAGPCEAPVPGAIYLGVDGGMGPHCGVAYAAGTRATLGASAIS